MRREYSRAWRQKITAVPDRLKKALHWVGIEHGRASTYEKLLMEFSQGHQSNEHFLAYYEATQILSIFDSWHDRAADFPRLQDRISFVFKKGTILSESESASANSNRPRNDAFVYMLAGKLLHAGEAQIISVDGIRNARTPIAGTKQHHPADIILFFRESMIMIECKRPMSEATLNENAESAFRQLTEHIDRQTLGIIAIDASRIIRRPGEYLEASSVDTGSKFLTDVLEKLLAPLAARYNHKALLGVLGFLMAPLVITAKSRILKSDGTPFTLENLLTAADSYVCIKNQDSPQGDLLHEILRFFSRTTHDVPQDSVPMT